MLCEIRNFRTCDDKAYGKRPTEQDIRGLANAAITYNCICKVVWEEEYLVEKPFHREDVETEIVSFSAYPIDPVEDTVDRFNKSMDNWIKGIDNEGEK